ncbi:transglutaminase family protein [Novosphingobium sp.]|uniref:transglutaminase-like domain-containing protein n=1 Tax=Novosphingobium sp. TaxID=1874826 RepID=UPI003450EF02
MIRKGHHGLRPGQTMHLSITTRLRWHCEEPTDSLLQIEVAATSGQRLLANAFEGTPAGHVTRVPAQDGIGERIWLHQEGDCTVTYAAEVEVLGRSVALETLAALPPHRLPGEAVPYLMDSRYCPANRFSPFVDEEFAAFEGGAKVAAMRDWIAAHYRYVPGVSDASTTAIDSFVERRGVCRDYAHTLICFARAAAIPARFASGYGADVTPQDFHAVAEVWLANPEGVGGWHLVDATGMADTASFAQIAVGRDAADTSFLTSFGQADLRELAIEVREVASLNHVR